MTDRPRFFRLSEEQMMSAVLPEDMINECMSWLYPHDLEAWQNKMKPVHVEFQSVLEDWFENVSFFVDHHTQLPIYIKFIRSNHLIDIEHNFDGQYLSAKTKDYYGIDRFPKYIVWHSEFNCIHEHFDSEYCRHTW